MRFGFTIGSAAALMLLFYASSASTADDQPAAKAQADPAPLMAAAKSARESFVRGGAPSVDALMEKFVRALSNSDKDALAALLVNREEYVDLIVPGTVPVGHGPRQVSDQPKEYYWKMLSTKDHYFQESLLTQFGGRRYRDYTLKFTQPAKEYAWYKAYGRVKLDLRGEDELTYSLSTGWVAEVDGKYKFIGYETDD
jgi:hypothetical protein